MIPATIWLFAALFFWIAQGGAAKQIERAASIRKKLGTRAGEHERELLVRMWWERAFGVVCLAGAMISLVGTL